MNAEWSFLVLLHLMSRTNLTRVAVITQKWVLYPWVFFIFLVLWGWVFHCLFISFACSSTENNYLTIYTDVIRLHGKTTVQIHTGLQDPELSQNQVGQKGIMDVSTSIMNSIVLFWCWQESGNKQTSEKERCWKCSNFKLGELLVSVYCGWVVCGVLVKCHLSNRGRKGGGWTWKVWSVWWSDKGVFASYKKYYTYHIMYVLHMSLVCVCHHTNDKQNLPLDCLTS